jgi:phosphate:Na+ symporter
LYAGLLAGAQENDTAMYIALIDLAGSIALLLWGVHMVSTGIERTFGARLRHLLSLALGNRLKAFLAGLGVTALLQSSTATGLMLTSFTASGLVGLVPALGAMLGANVGTTLIVQLLAFDISHFAPALILLGVILFRRGTRARFHDLGRVAIGLGLMLLALHQLLSLVEPYETMPILREVLRALASQPILAVALATLLTWAAHSSVAIVLLVMSLAANGTIPLETACALVLGANLGTAVNPILEGSGGAGPVARRLPIGNFANRAFGCLIGLALLHWVVPELSALVPDVSRAVATFHTAFNAALALLFFPFLDPLAGLLIKRLPAPATPADPARPLYLTPATRAHPTMAIAEAMRESLRMVDIVESMLAGARAALQHDRRQTAEVRRLDDVLDGLNAAIKHHLTALEPGELRTEDQQRSLQILIFVTNLEQAGDIIDRNLARTAAKMLKRNISFSPQDAADIWFMFDRLQANLQAAAAVYVTEDARGARQLANEKETFRQIEERATEAHFDRLRAGRIDSAETSAFHLDLIRDLKQINAHLVAAAAYPILKDQGELLPSRLKQLQKRVTTERAP